MKLCPFMRKEQLTCYIKLVLLARLCKKKFNPLDWGWQLSDLHGKCVPTPIWDTEDSMQKIDIIRQSIMHQCACRKTECNLKKRQYQCVREGTNCSLLCTCSGCKNVFPHAMESDVNNQTDIGESEIVYDSSSSESDYSDIQHLAEWQWTT